MPLEPYKVRISFELDLTEHPGVCVDDKESLPCALQNLGSWLDNLQQYYREDALHWSLKAIGEKESIHEKMYEHLSMQADLAKQIFNNYQIEGTLADGTTFTFTHKEPGYEESLVIHE